MRFYIITAFVLLLALPACSRFRLKKLKPDRIFSAAIGPAGVVYPNQNGIYHEIPYSHGVINDWVILSEPSERTLKLFRNGRLSTRVVAKTTEEPAKKDAAKSAEAKPKPEGRTVVADILKVPGRISAGQNEDFFVENYIPPGDWLEKKGGKGVYKILHFDLKGKFLHLIGRKGQTELPFENLLWMDTDKKGNLWVLYRYLDELHLDSYEGNKLVFEMRQPNCEAILFDRDQPKDKGQFRRCEFMYPFYNAEKLVLVGRIDKPGEDAKELSFSHRIIKVKKTEEDGTELVFSRLNNPEDYPYIPQPDGEVSLWQTLDHQKVKLALYNLSGDLLNTLQLEHPGKHNEWRATYQTLRGDFYSTRITGGYFEIYQWK